MNAHQDKYKIPAELFNTDERFWSRVAIAYTDDCWHWTGPRNADGYGTCSHGAAHRHAWRLANGVEIPDGMYVLHSCDCRDCVNPAHLMLGTQSENMRQKFARGRHTDFRRKLQPRDVLKIRSSGLGYAQLAQRYRVTPGFMRCVLNGLKWPRVDDRQPDFLDLLEVSA